MRRWRAFRQCMLLWALVYLAAAIAGGATAESLSPGSAAPDSRRLVRELISIRGRSGPEGDPQAAAILQELEAKDPDLAARWKAVLACWSTLPAADSLPDVLPEGLPDTDELCIVVLGYQLNPDGSIRDELEGRLETALRCAEKYPHAYIACTGGPTAYGNPAATEAGRMGEWLETHGIARERLILEDQSRTTVQNAVFTCRILAEQFPRVSRLAVVSSDYHVPSGILLFEAEAVLQAPEAGRETVHVVSAAAYRTAGQRLSAGFESSALSALWEDACAAAAADEAVGEK